MNRCTSTLDKHANKPLNFCQLNIDGLSAHSKTALNKFCSDQHVSIMALQETKLIKSQVGNLDSTPGMESFFLPKEESTHGVGLLVSQSLYPQRITALEEPNLDIIWCSVKISTLDVLIASTYCPPRNNTEALLKTIKNIKAAYTYGFKNKIQNVLVFGDFNARNINWGDTTTNQRGRILFDFVNGSDFMLYTPADKTFICPQNGGSVIDLMLAQGKIKDIIQENWIEKTTELFTGAPIRGHYPVIYSIGVNNPARATKIYQDYNNTDWEVWTDLLECELECSAGIIDSECNLEELVDQLNNAIKHASESIPSKIICKHSKPFWTPSLTTASKELSKLRSIAQRRRTPLNTDNLRQKKEEFKSLLIKEKNDWIKEKLTNINVADSVTFWKRYKSLFGNVQSNLIGNLVCNNIIHTKDTEKEQILYNTFFSGKHLENNTFDKNFEGKITAVYDELIGKNLQQNSESTKHIHRIFRDTGVKILLKDSDKLSEEILNREVTDTEIRESISKQKSNGKCSDSYQVNPVMLKHFGVNARSTLKRIFNLSLQNGQWGWRDSEVCFLKKEGKDSYLNPGSYRPICISSYIGKIFERIIESRIRSHCDFFEILDIEQEGFCPQRSTTRYLFKLMANLNEAKAKKLTSMILLIDFQKAFDSVWIPGLITKLYSYGITGNILKVVNDFLTSRKICLKVNSSIGEPRSCNLIGLPQGSVLSPLLFIMYITDMLNNIHEYGPARRTTETKAYKYADDGTITVIGSTIEECRITLQCICDEIMKWCNLWRLLVNCDRNKTEVIRIENQQHDSSDIAVPKIKMGQSELQYVEKSKVLGVIIDKDLTFKQHGSDVLTRCWYGWFRICKNTTRLKGLNTASLRLLFNTLVITRLMYAAPVWLGKQLALFKDLWSKVILKISGSEYHTQRDLTEVMLNIPPIDIQYNVIAIKFLLKCMKSDDDMIATILQIDENRLHTYYRLTQQLKSYLAWKRRETDGTQHRRNTTRDIDLIEFINHKDCYYTKTDITQYLNYTWHQAVQHRQPAQPLWHWDTNHHKQLFPRGSFRDENTSVAEFIHGHSLRFGNFRKTIKIEDSDICEYCNEMADSPQHQLFECPAFECPERKELLLLLQQNISDFNWKIITNGIPENQLYAITLFLKLVYHINTVTDTIIITDAN